MRHLQLLIKPVSSECNLACTYCFFEDECKHRSQRSYGKMTEETMEAVIKNALENSTESCTFGFQGGEPALAGLSYFEKFTELVRKYRKKNLKVQYVLQTNGTLLTDEWFPLLKREKFLVGISLDGTKEIHNQNRKDKNGKNTYLKVRNTGIKLQKAGIDVNILCVITKQSTRHIQRIYRSFKEDGFFYQQYIPCLDGIGQNGAAWSLEAEDFGKAMIELFELWFEDFCKGSPVYIREFDQWLDMLLGGFPQACVWRGECTMQNVIEANGDVYPCDFYVLEEYCLGNVRDQGFSLGKTGEEERFFAEEKERRAECKECRKCKWYPLCRGGCPREYVIDSAGIYGHKLCQGYQQLFAYMVPRLEWLAAKLSSK